MARFNIIIKKDRKMIKYMVFSINGVVCDYSINTKGIPIIGG